MIHINTALSPEEAGLCSGLPVQSITEGRPESALFFDIETTGLSPDTAFVFLIGCICQEDGQWRMHQFLIRFVQEERQLLSAFFSLAGHYPILIHFNGNRFDLPFLCRRAEAIQMDFPLPDADSRDLYLRYRPLKKLLGLSHMNQRSLEDWVGWHRTDELESREMIARYWSYSVNKDKETEALLLGHNRDDLLGMLRVPALEAYQSLGLGLIRPEVTGEPSQNGSALTIQFETELPLPRPLTLSRKLFPDSSLTADAPKTPAGLTLSVRGGEGAIRIPIFTGRLRYYFKDYKNYFYLPMEHQVIHKSVASFVEKRFREPATPQNCFAEQSGRFLPQPEELFSPALRESYDSKAAYFSYRPDFCSKKQDLCAYAQTLLRYMIQL